MSVFCYSPQIVSQASLLADAKKRHFSSVVLTKDNGDVYTDAVPYNPQQPLQLDEVGDLDSAQVSNPLYCDKLDAVSRAQSAIDSLVIEQPENENQNV